MFARREKSAAEWRLVDAGGLLAAGLVLVAVSAPAMATPLSDADFSALAAQCAPSVPVSLLHGIARTESGVQPWMLHDNSFGISEAPASLAGAEADAEKWIGEGHSVDLGLMQINSGNLPALGMSVSAALDPCASLAAGAAVLRAAYGGAPVAGDQQVELLEALSLYNTGTPLRGIMNGYARTVIDHAGETGAVTPAAMPVDLSEAPDMPPSWDIAATGNYSQAHGAPWLVPLALSTPSPSASIAPNSPPTSQSRRSP